MQDTTRNVLNGVLVGVAILVALMLGVLHGTAVGETKAIMEYELGYEAGKRDALYSRPVSNELEMVCLGLWLGSLPERKDAKL
jgi:hypothetical protein